MPVKFVVGYCRFSSSNQREESIDAQKRAIRKWCKDKGYVLLRFYCDLAKSGKSDNRPEFLQMIEDSSKGEFQTVAVHKLDRFSRSKFDAVFYKGKLKRNNVRVESVLEALDGSPEAIILESLLEGMNEYYSANLKRETLKGMFESAYECLHMGGIPPLGLDVDKETRKYVVNHAESLIVKQIFEKYIEGWGYQRIADYLNACGFQTKAKKAFQKTSIHSILKNERYIGTYTFNKAMSRDYRGARQGHLQKPEQEVIRVENAFEAILDKPTFDRVQALLERNKKLSGQFKAKNPDQYLLSGRVFCGKCGAPLHGNSRLSGGGQRCSTYRCSKRAKDKNACNTKEVLSQWLDQAVLREINQLMFNAKQKNWLLKRIDKYGEDRSNQNEAQAKELKQAIAGLKEKIARMIQLVQAGCDVNSVTEEIKTLEETKRAFEDRLENCMNSAVGGLTVQKIEAAIKAFEESVENGNVRAYKKLIPLFVEKVLLFNNRVEVLMKLDLKKSLTRDSMIHVDKNKTCEISKRFDGIV
jgi:site-specific DNA recombinase